MNTPSSTELASAVREDCAPDSGSSGAIARPERTTRLLLLALVFGLCNRTYWLYSNTDHYWPQYWMPYVKGVGAAPEQYRIGVKMTAWWLVQHLGWGFRHGYALMDLIGSVAAVLLLYDLLWRKPVVKQASLALQWFASAAFVMLAGFYLAWVPFYFRPETLPTTGLVAVMLWLWTPPGSTERTGLRQMLVICGVLCATAAQATVRADVACVFNVGIFVVSCSRFGRELSLRRSTAIVTSGVAVALALAIQLYIMRVAYPHASYGNIPVVMVRYDFLQPLGFPPFFFFMVPVIWTAVQFWRQRKSEDGVTVGLTVASALYFILWVVMGKLDEVRIFIPFALALAPTSVELALRHIRGEAPVCS